MFRTGVCGCLDYDLTQGDDYLALMDQFVFLSAYIGDHTGDVKRQVVEALCTGVTNDGDHLQVRNDSCRVERQDIGSRVV